MKIRSRTLEILKACIGARAALAELKSTGRLIPNQGILINTLPVLEAQASSEIENIVTTADRLFQFRQADEHADPATKEAIRYSYALQQAYSSLVKRPLSTRPELFKIFLLGLMAGLRRLEIDLLEWTSFQAWRARASWSW